MSFLERVLGVLAALITIYTFFVSIAAASFTNPNFVSFRTPEVLSAVSGLSLPSRSILAIVIQVALGRFFASGCRIADKAISEASMLVGIIAAAAVTGWLTLFVVETLLIGQKVATLVLLALVLVGMSVNAFFAWLDLGQDEGTVLAGVCGVCAQYAMFGVIAVSSVTISSQVAPEHEGPRPEPNSAYSVLIFHKPYEQAQASALADALLTAGFKSSATPTELKESNKQLPPGQARVIYTPRGQGRLSDVEKILTASAPKVQFITEPKSSNLHQGDIQVLLF